MPDHVEPLSRYKQRKLDAVMNVAPRVIGRLYRPDCCIAATRILQLVFRALNVWSRPLSVTAEVLNPKYLELQAAAEHFYPLTVEEGLAWREAGAWSVVLGWPDEVAQPGKWPGHLVCVVWEKVILDVALQQASRPHKGIEMPPLAVVVPPEFLAGGETRACTVNGCDVHYEAKREDRSYEKAKDWQDVSRHRAAVAEILSHARRQLP